MRPDDLSPPTPVLPLPTPKETIALGSTIGNYKITAALEVAASDVPVMDYHTPRRSSAPKIWVVLAGFALAGIVLIVMGLMFFAKSSSVSVPMPVPSIKVVAPPPSAPAGVAMNQPDPPTEPTNSSFTPTNTKPVSNQVVPEQPKTIDTPTTPMDNPSTLIGGLIGELNRPTIVPPATMPHVFPPVDPKP